MQIQYSILYILYGLFIISALVTSRSFSGGMYLFNLVSILFLFLIIFFNKRIYKENFASKNVIYFIVIYFYAFAFVLYSRDLYSFLFILKISLIFTLFKFYKFERLKLIEFVNKTYLIYVILSSLFFYIFPNTITKLITHPTYYVDAYFFEYLIFQSIEGSAATIDSYSGLVFCLNLLLYKGGKNRTLYICISALFVILSLKMTPLVSLIFSLLGYLIIKKKIIGLVYLVSGLGLFVLSLFLLFVDPKISGINFSMIMYLATHARSMVWIQQIEILLTEYTILDYFFGNFSSELFSVQAFQFDGSERDLMIDNPHNNFLLLFYRMPLFTIIIFLTFFKRLYLNFDRSFFVIAVFIFIACFTNSALISLQNPIYLIILSYILNLNIHEPKQKISQLI